MRIDPAIDNRRVLELSAGVCVACAVCGTPDPEPVCHARTERILSLVVPIAICRRCGFVYVNPRWSAAQYDRVMDLWFPGTFAQDPPTDPDENKRFRKWRVMDERIASFYPAGIRNLLDIGAGQGWCIEFLLRKHPSMRPYVIERWPACQRHVSQAYGAEVISDSLDSAWDEGHEGRFDLIVFRHTLEHVLDPLAVLRKIRRCLSDDGRAYIVVPDMRAVKGHLVSDFFRPVHLSYFCEETLAAVAAGAGLEPEVLQSDFEVWGLFRKGPERQQVPDLYREMKALIQDVRAREFWREKRTLLRFDTLHALDRLKLRRLASRLRRRVTG